MPAVVRMLGLGATFAALLGPLAGAQSVREGKMFVRADSISDRPLTALLRIVLQDSALVRPYRSYLVRPGDNLYQIVYEQFGLGSTEHDSASALIVDYVARVSQLPNRDALKRGDTLLLPNLTKITRPRTTSPRTDRIQIMTMKGSGVFNSTTGVVSGVSSIRPDENIPLWEVDLSGEQLVEARRLMTAASTRRDRAGAFFIDAPTSLVKIEGDGVVPDEGLQPDPAPSVHASLALPQGRGSLVILDIFGPTCEAHGQRVRSVVDKQFEELGATHLATFVRHIDISATSDTAFKKRILVRFAEKYLGPSAAKSFRAIGDTIIANARSAGGIRVSPLFMQAILDSLASDPSVSVVSSSFQTVSRYGFLASPTQVRSLPLFISAAGNDSTYQPQLIPSRQLDSIGGFFMRQPQTEYRNRSGSQPFFLIGGISRRHDLYGAYGSRPDQIPLVEYANGWSKGCIKSDYIGTSFATPAVAASMYWLISSTVNAVARTPDRILQRVMQSADVAGAFREEYAAGAPVDRRKLKLDTEAYAVTNEGIPVALLRLTGRIRVRSQSGEWEDRSLRSNDIASILKQPAGRFVVFDVPQRRWRSTEVELVQLSIAGSPTACSTVNCAVTEATVWQSFRELGVFP